MKGAPIVGLASSAVLVTEKDMSDAIMSMERWRRKARKLG